MSLFSRLYFAAPLFVVLTLSALPSASAQDSKPSPQEKEPAAQKKEPRSPARPEGADTAKPVNTKAEIAGDTNATGEELGKVLEVHGVTCAQCEGDACSGCRMKPLPEGAGDGHFPPDAHGQGCGHGNCPHAGHKMGHRGKHHHKMMQHLQHTRRSVVRVVNARERGTGFLFGTRRHVITALDVVDSGRATHVVDHNGAEIDARIVGTDRGAGLALLELDAELSDAEPLQAADQKGPQFGHAMVIGNHYGAGQRWGVDLNKLTNGVVQAATISSRDGDALLLGNSFPDTFAGAPVVAPNGQLLGVIRWVKRKHHSSIATSAHRVQGFYNAHSETQSDEYQGRIRLHMGGGVIGFAGNESTFGAGLQLSTSVDFFDMFGATLRAAYALGTQDLSDDDFTTDILSRNYGRWILDGVAYYRFLIPGFYGKKTPVSLGAGGAYVHDSGDERILRDSTFVTNEFTYGRGMFEADLQIGWLRGSFFIRPDETEDWFFTLSASMQY